MADVIELMAFTERAVPAHHGRVQLHGDDDEPVICRCDVGIEGEPLHDRRAVDDGDVEVARRILERELQGLLVEQKLVLVYEVDDGGVTCMPLSSSVNTESATVAFP